MNVNMDLTKEREHMRKLSRKLDKTTREALHDQPIVKKKTRKRAAVGGRSIRVEIVPQGAGLDSPGEHGETHLGLTHAIVAFSAAMRSSCVMIHRNEMSANRVKNRQTNIPTDKQTN